MTVMSLTRLLLHAKTLTTPQTGKDQVERLLALGASRSEATSDLLTRSTKLAMTPLLNQMSVVGLVSIPGERVCVCVCGGGGMCVCVCVGGGGLQCMGMKSRQVQQQLHSWP